MRLRLQLTTLTFLLLSQISMANKEPVFNPVIALFAAMSAIDHDRMKSAVTKDFILLEHGEVWTIEDLIDAVKPSAYTRTNYFSIIGINQQANIAWINYWNKANFDNKKNSQDVVWLESVVVVKKQGLWHLAQMHSTRLDPDKVPSGIAFIKQPND